MDGSLPAATRSPTASMSESGDATPERVVALADQAAAITATKAREIRRITSQTRMLALNGPIEAGRAVYVDLWVCSRDGRVIGHGRPDRYTHVKGLDVSSESWIRDALATMTGDDYAVADIAKCVGLGGVPVATYAAAVRQGGETRGQVIGVLGIHFDWAPPAQAGGEGVPLSPGGAEP